MNLASNSNPNQFDTTRRIAIYEPLHQFNMWGDFIEYPDTIPSAILHDESNVPDDDQLNDPLNALLRSSNGYEEHEAIQASKPPEKVLRRLAQNRQAARKSRLRKKAYVQQLENCKLRLFQLEQELERTKQQDRSRGVGLDDTMLNVPSTVNSGNSNIEFEMEYGQWMEELDRKVIELRNVLLSQVSDTELSLLVDGIMMHYFELFRMKSTAAKADVFYVMNGMWKTSVERLFMWIGGIRPSVILKIMLLRIETEVMTLTKEQHLHIDSLRQSCQQAEDALSQGMEKLHEITTQTVASGRLGEGNYLPQIKSAMEKLEALARFVNQADHLRQETLKQMYRILTIRQAARALLLLGEYLQCLRTMTTVWIDRNRKTI